MLPYESTPIFIGYYIYKGTIKISKTYSEIFSLLRTAIKSRYCIINTYYTYFCYSNVYEPYQTMKHTQKDQINVNIIFTSL